ncbi:MAG: MATE family efflux transporter [Eubacteriales bacterium]|nr:MATE family efflux transporter [Eubacteriales bacterium]
MKDDILKGVLAIGIPAALGDILMSVSSIVLNGQMANYGDMVVAGVGVAMKITMITGMICIGFGQGIQPLLGYCVGAKNWKRYKASLRFSVIFGFELSTFMTIICYVFDRQIVGVFLSDPEAFQYGVEFSRILLTTSFLFGMFYVLSNALQAMGAATSALIINMSRQGLIYIPVIFILQSIIGMDGLLWAQPVADILSVVLVVILYRVTLKNKIHTQEQMT